MRRAPFAIVILSITSAILGMGTMHGSGSGLSTPSKPGSTKATAVKLCSTFGEIRYVSRLTCANGKSAVSRIVGHAGTRVERTGESGGAEGQSEVIRHTIEKYEVRCGMKVIAVYVDMNHCPAPEIEGAPEGLIFTPRADK